MTDPDFDPAACLRAITWATERLLATADRLDERAVREPSLLPGWSRGHVLTHLARNADGGTRLLTWARTGIPRLEYPSRAARAQAIEAGAARTATALAADVRAAAARFAAAYARVPVTGWLRTVRWTTGGYRPAVRIADARLTEVLVHHVDLRADLTPDGWPAVFVTAELGRVVRSFAARADAVPLRLHAIDTGRRYAVGAGARADRVTGPQSALLAWLMGRSPGTGLTVDSGGAPPALPLLY